MRHVRTIVRSSLALLAPLALVASGACAAGDGGNGTPTAEVAAAAGSASVHVTLSDFAIAPKAIAVPVGRELTFHIENTGAAPHSFAVVVGPRTLASPMIDPAGTGELTVPSLEAGTYDALCTASGHTELGMMATVVAAEEGAATSGGSDPNADPMDMASMTAEQMADMHRASVETFPAETRGTGNEILKPEVVDGVKVFTLWATQIRWEVSPGVVKEAMAYNGQIPGPQLQVQLGDRVRIVFQNQLDQPTVLHLHGMTLPNGVDGVPYITQDPVMPGSSYGYMFTVKDPPGMYVYHSHFNSTEQVGSGLYGAILVEPTGGRWPYPGAEVDPRDGSLTYSAPPDVDVEATMFVGDGPLGFVLNGKSFPATKPIVAARGDWVLIHMANDGAMLHPMHLHGYHF